MPISTYEQDKSKIFMSSLNKILEIIEELSAVVPEGKYLEICDNIAALGGADTRRITVREEHSPKTASLSQDLRFAQDVQQIGDGIWEKKDDSDVLEFIDRSRRPVKRFGCREAFLLRSRRELTAGSDVGQKRK